MSNISSKSLKKIAVCTFIVLICVVSIFLLGNKFTNVERYSSLIGTIDNQISSVQKLSVMSTITSTAISALPDDTATPIAEKLADFTGYFLLIMCILYLEKYAMPLLIGFGVFKILIPIIGIILIIGVVKGSKFYYSLSAKITLIALAVALVIPISVVASERIYSASGDKVANLVSESEMLQDEANQITDATSAGTILGTISEAVNIIVSKASSLISELIETTAVMIVASCVVPLIVILFFVWIIKMLVGKDTVKIIKS